MDSKQRVFLPNLTRAVYPSPVGTVNLFAISLLTSFCVLASLLAGCQSPQRTTDRFAQSYRVAIRYDVEPMMVNASPDRAWRRIETDLGRIARMGFTEVKVHYLLDSERERLLDTAANLGIRASVPDQKLQDYINLGLLGSSTFQTNLPKPIAEHPSFAGVVLHPGMGIEADARFEKIRNALVRQGIPIAEPTRIGELKSAGNPNGDRKRPAAQVWLHRFHQALAAGATAGFTFDRYKTISGEKGGFVVGDRAPNTADEAGLEAVCRRAKHWGRRVAGASCSELTPLSAPASEAFEVKLFSRGARRFVLLFNSSENAYIRGEVILPDKLAQPSIRRAVEIPKTPDRTLGKVYRTGVQGLSITIDIRPGDAMLFELF